MKSNMVLSFIIFLLLSSNIYSQSCGDIQLPKVKNPIDKLNTNALIEYEQTFSYSPYEEVYILDDNDKRKKYKIQELKLDTKDPANPDNDYSYYATLYTPLKNKKRPLIIIYPSIKGVTFIETNLAKHLAKKGFNTLVSIVPRDKNIHKLPVNALNQSLHRSTSGMSLWIDYFSQQSYVDNKKIGIFGTSDGGNRASLAIGVEKRISATVLFVAGGNFPKMFADSEQKIIKGYRNYKQATENLSYTDYYTKMKKELTYDPIYLAHKKETDDIFMFIALKDRSVPTNRQIELWEAFGRPKSICKDVKHVRGALYSTVLEDKIEEFYRERFEKR